MKSDLKYDDDNDDDVDNDCDDTNDDDVELMIAKKKSPLNIWLFGMRLINVVGNIVTIINV